MATLQVLLQHGRGYRVPLRSAIGSQYTLVFMLFINVKSSRYCDVVHSWGGIRNLDNIVSCACGILNFQQISEEFCTVTVMAEFGTCWLNPFKNFFRLVRPTVRELGKL